MPVLLQTRAFDLPGVGPWSIVHDRSAAPMDDAIPDDRTTDQDLELHAATCNPGQRRGGNRDNGPQGPMVRCNGRSGSGSLRQSLHHFGRQPCGLDEHRFRCG